MRLRQVNLVINVNRPRMMSIYVYKIDYMCVCSTD